MTVRRRGDAHRWIRWLWTDRSIGARCMRALLLPASGLWQAAHAIRWAPWTLGWRAAARLPLPSVSVGNLSVGGSGKTPIAAWIAARYAESGRRPAIVLRGTGGDEPRVHRDLVPGAIVIADAHRPRGTARALADGADVVVLDDAYQRRDVARDLNLCLISAESAQAAPWSLPAGPWRERLTAVHRADLVIITRKRADVAAADRLEGELRRRGFRKPIVRAHLALHALHGLVSRRETSVETLAGKRVVAASAIGDPEAFVAQVKRTGAQVQVATWKDHHRFRDEDVAWLAHAARRADVVVVTGKDAVKLRDRWPASVPEPLVATLAVSIEAGIDDLSSALDRLVARPPRLS